MNNLEIIIKDETMTGAVKNQFIVKATNEKMKVKDLIKMRIFHEVEAFNQTKSDFFRGLVQPIESNQVHGQHNLYKITVPKLIDAEKQYYLALNVFQKNGFFILIDNIQYSELEEEIIVHKNLTVSFIRLIALVGG